MTEITTYIPQIDLMPANADKDTAHRIGKFEAWLNETGRNLNRPDLASNIVTTCWPIMHPQQ